MPAKKSKIISFSKCMPRTCYSGIYFSGRGAVSPKGRRTPTLQEEEPAGISPGEIACLQNDEANGLEGCGFETSSLDEEFEYDESMLSLDEDDEGFDY